MNLIITGNPYNVNILKKHLINRKFSFSIEDRKLRFIDRKIVRIINCNLIHIFSIKPNGYEGKIWILIFIFLKLLRKKVILHWIGTDVLDLESSYGNIFSKLIDKHLTYSPWLVEELGMKNIDSTFLPVIPQLHFSDSPLPEKLSVLIFLKKNFDFYGGNEVQMLVDKFPDVKFNVVGNMSGGESLVRSPNVNYFGRVGYERMLEIYDESTVLLRLTKHDGLSLMVLEALSRGRYVIWTKKFPYCYEANTISEAIIHLRNLQNEKKINIAGRDFIKKSFNDDAWLNDLIKLYHELACE